MERVLRDESQVWRDVGRVMEGRERSGRVKVGREGRRDESCGVVPVGAERKERVSVKLVGCTAWLDAWDDSISPALTAVQTCSSNRRIVSSRPAKPALLSTVPLHSPSPSSPPHTTPHSSSNSYSSQQPPLPSRPSILPP